MNKSESKYFNTAVKMNRALIEILETKDFEYITIKEICDKALVNRSTFYLHYENTSELLAETTNYLIDGFLSYFPLDTTQIVHKFHDCDLSELNFISDKYLHPHLSYIKDNKRIFATAITHINSFGFDTIYQKMFQHIFDPILNRFHYPVDDRKYVMAFYLNGINAIVIEWLKDSCSKSIEGISNVILKCVFGMVHDFDANLAQYHEKRN